MNIKAQKRPVILTLILVMFVTLWLIVAIFPFLWTFWGSFKVEADFFSKIDWKYSIFGIRTLAETGYNFTGNGYEGAWIE